MYVAKICRACIMIIGLLGVVGILYIMYFVSPKATAITLSTKNYSTNAGRGKG
jgi:hypothetical protein